MIFVGFDSNTKGYRCINPSTKELIISRDVIFHENYQNDSNDEICIIPNSDSVRKIDEENKEDDVIDITLESSEVMDENSKDADYIPPRRIDTTKRSPVKTRSNTAKDERPLNLLNFVFFTDPVTVHEAKNSSDAIHWKRAMDEEMQAHKCNNTWTLVDLPLGVKPIKTKWVFKAKCDDEGNISRYKARLVAKGYSQKFGVDYNETYSPVVRYTSIRYLIALAARENLKIYQMDVTTAFLQGDLNESIYIDQPDEFNDGTNRVCKLNKALYGLKQAGRMWNLKLDAPLKNYCLNKCVSDPCIYYKDNLELIIAIYVDDFDLL